MPDSYPLYPSQTQSGQASGEINGRPDYGVLGLVIADRATGKYTLAASWKLPSDATSDKNDRRTTYMNITWTVYYETHTVSGHVSTTSLLRCDKTYNVWDQSQFTSHTFPFCNLDSTLTGRDSFNPGVLTPDGTASSSVYVKSVSVAVMCCNNFGSGPTEKVTWEPSVPAAPTVGAFSFDPATGKTSVKITAAADDSFAERRDTYYDLEVMAYRSGYDATNRVIHSVKGAFRGSEKTLTYDYPSFATLADGEYVKLTLLARSRGLAGNSPPVHKAFYLSPPAKPTMGAVEVSGKGHGGVVTVPVTVSYKKETHEGTTYTINPVSHMKLQRCFTSSKVASQIPATDEFSDVGSEDNGTCTALVANSVDLVPQPGQYVFVRVMAWRFDDPDVASMVRYSAYRRLDEFFVPVDATGAGDATCEVVVCRPGDDGESATVTVAWDRSSTEADDDADGTEVAWSEHVDAWESTDQPKTFDVEWGEAVTGSPQRWYNGSARTKTVEGSTVPSTYDDKWLRQSTLIVRGLDRGKRYWFRARRYKSVDNRRTQGAWCAARYADTLGEDEVAAKPASVTATLPTLLPWGRDLTVAWSHDGDAEQAGWKVRIGIWDASQGKWTRSEIAASGADDWRGVSIPWSVVEGYASTGVVWAYVGVTCGGAWTWSDKQSVAVALPPVVGVACADVTAQPMSMSLACDDPEAEVAIVVTSRGVAGETPDGTGGRQAEGDCVWSWAGTPAWGANRTWGQTEFYARAVAAASARVTELSQVEGYDVEGTEAHYEYECAVTERDALVARYPSSGTCREATVVAPPGLDLRDGGTHDVVVVATSPSTGLASEEAACAFAVAWAHQATPPSFAIEVAPYDETDEAGVREVGAMIVLDAPSANLTPFFSEPWSGSYWANSTGGIHSVSTRVGGGWLSVDAMGTAWRSESVRSTAISLQPSSTYTLLCEVSGLNPDEVRLKVDGAGVPDGAVSLVITEDGAHRATFETLATIPGSDLQISMSCYPQKSFSVRLSLYEGEYEGNYAPYTAPADRSGPDVYDVYRVTADGVMEAARGVPCGATVRDRHAPFGDGPLAYRVVTRTPDGDTAWADYPYELDVRTARIDWDGGWVDLPFGLSVNHQYSKDSEQRDHIGASLPEGYWGSSRRRTVTISADAIRALSAQDRRMLHELGRHMGPCLVRTPDGCCLEADMSVGGMPAKAASPIVAVSLSGVEIAPSGLFAAEVEEV